MNFVLNLDVQKIRQSTEHGVGTRENRIVLEGKAKCADHDISLGGVAPLSEATGIVRLLNESQAEEMKYDKEACIGKVFIIEEYGEWFITGVVMMESDQHTELWKRLEQDRGLRFVKILVSDETEDPAPQSITLNAKDRFNLEAMEVEYIYEVAS